MTLNVRFTEVSQKFEVGFSPPSMVFESKFGEVQTITNYVGGEPYHGEYVVTPRVTEQMMPTKNKILLEDVTVKSIPFFNVSNTSGGSTVYIGDEV